MDWINLASKFDLGDHPVQTRPVAIEARRQRDGSRLWVVQMHEWVLTKSGEWVYEPIPSSRTKSFIRRTRFANKEAAYKAYCLTLGSKQFLSIG